VGKAGLKAIDVRGLLMRVGSEEGLPLTRRQFLVVSGAAAAAAYASGLIGRASEALADSSSLTLMLFRREDMVWLRYSFYNLVLAPQKSGTPQLIRETAGQKAYVVVQFASQHVSEQGVDITASGPGAGQILTKVSGPSQIAFVVPDDVASIPCTDKGLLSWHDWTMNIVDLSALPVPSTTDAPPAPPGPLFTDLQVVDHLHLSPHEHDARWENAADPVTSPAGRTEVWGTRLVPPAGSSGAPPIRAVAYENDTTGNFGNGSPGSGISGVSGLIQVFKPFDPHDIYVATDFNPSDVPGAAPASADLLMMTALGSWLEIEGAWGQALGAVPIAEWRHRSTQGRDNYVKVVDRGVLFPFGHHAELVTISERQVHSDGVAYIYKRSFVRVKEPTRTYPAFAQLDKDTKQVPFPFTDVTLKTLVTPDILIPTVAAVPDPSGGSFFTPPSPPTPQPDLLPPGAPGEAAFWLQIDTGGSSNPDVPFHLVATDLAGNTVDFSASLAFMYLDYTTPDGGAYVPANVQPAVDYYNNKSGFGMEANNPRRLINLGGQKLAFAPERKPGDASHPTSQLALGAQTPDPALGLNTSSSPSNDFYKQGQPAFAPRMTAAQVRVPAIEALQGGGAATGEGPVISYSYSYLKHGTGPADPASLTVEQALTDNPGGLYALITDPNADTVAGNLGAAIDAAAKAAADSQTYVTTFEAAVPTMISQAGDLSGKTTKEAIDLIQGTPAYSSAISGAAGLFNTSAKLAGDLAGGVATPNLSPGGLAQSLGPISGGTLDKITSGAQGFVNPAKFFEDGDPKILGSISLASILPTNIPFSSSASSDQSPTAPRIQTTVIYPNGDKTKPPTGTMTVLDWAPDPVSFGPLFFPSTNPDNQAQWSGPGPLKNSNANSTFKLHVVLQTFLNGSPPTYDISGTLTNFVMDLLAPSKDYFSSYPTSAGGGSPPDGPTFFVITFNRLAFTAKSGAKPNFSVDIADVTFDGPLQFINALEQFLSNLGDGLAIDVKPTSISASLSLPIPSITLGVIALQNLSFGASLFLPFTGDPFRVGANFCTRENPFLVTILCLGGGGFVGVTLGPDGLQVVEASLEVAASAAINIGIASGSVTLAIGIYFKLEQQSNGVDEVTLTGYFQANGQVCVLGLVTIALEIYLGLTYMTPPPVVSGEATITLTVEIGPFSKSLSAHVQRQFAGGDPPAGLTFGQMMTQSDWTTYCDAFAA
jgi:hypothetical protein